MHGDFRQLVHPGTPADDIDVEGTRQERRRINEAIRAQHLMQNLSADPPVPTLTLRVEKEHAEPSSAASTVTGEEYAVLLADIQRLLQSLGRDANTPHP